MEHRSSSGPFFEAVFALLVAELVIIGLLTLPFPGGIRGVIVRWISTSNLLQMCAKPLLYFSVLVVLSFLFTTREMLKLQSDYHELTFGDLAERCAPEQPARRGHTCSRHAASTLTHRPSRRLAGCSTRRRCSARSATSTSRASAWCSCS